jgi:hypothetical protein
MVCTVLTRLARRDALERVSNGLNKPWTPGRRVFPSAVAAKISGVDPSERLSPVFQRIGSCTLASTELILKGN